MVAAGSDRVHCGCPKEKKREESLERKGKERPHSRINGFETCFDTLDFGFGDEVNFVDQQAVGKGDLLHGFVFSSFRLFFVQVLFDVFGIDQRDNAVEPCKFFDVFVHKERLSDRGWVGQTSGFDDDTIKFEPVRHPGGQFVEDNDQILAYRATDAAVHHFNDLFGGLHARVLLNQFVVNACGRREGNKNKNSGQKSERETKTVSKRVNPGANQPKNQGLSQGVGVGSPRSPAKEANRRRAKKREKRK